jgi:hypothetical protein
VTERANRRPYSQPCRPDSAPPFVRIAFAPRSTSFLASYDPNLFMLSRVLLKRASLPIFPRTPSVLLPSSSFSTVSSSTTSAFDRDSSSFLLSPSSTGRPNLPWLAPDRRLRTARSSTIPSPNTTNSTLMPAGPNKLSILSTLDSQISSTTNSTSHILPSRSIYAYQGRFSSALTTC